MRSHDPLRRLLIIGALIASLLTAIAMILVEAVHRRSPGEAVAPHPERR